MRLKLNKTNIRKLGSRPTRYEVADTETPAFRLRITPAGVKSFVIVYRNAENQLKRFTIGEFGNLTPEAARQIAEKKLAEVKLGKDPAAEKQETREQAKKQKYITLRGFLDHKYGPWVKANRKDGKATLKRLEACFAEFMDRELPDLSTWVIEKWRKERLEQGRAPSTVNRDITALKACLSRAVDWEVIYRHPLTKVKPARVDHIGTVRYLEQDEERRLREALDARDKRIKRGRDNGNQWRQERNVELLPRLSNHAYGDHLTPMVLLSLNTGMRRGEVFNLRWSDVNFGVQSLTIRGLKRIDEHSAKSGKTRHIPLNAEALDVLRKWKDQQEDTTDLVFPGRDGAPFNNVKKAWAGLLVDASITAFRWHDMRHHFASRLVMAGVDLNTVRELLGHSDIKMTLRYAHLAPEHKAAAVAKLVEA